MISVIEMEAAAVKAKLEAEIERAREESAKAQHSAYVNQSTEARAVLEGQYETANHTYEELKITRTGVTIATGRWCMNRCKRAR